VLLGDLGRKQVADDLLGRVLALEPVGQHLIERPAHAEQLELDHHLQDIMTFHGSLS
jgi:hypothetical protein